MSSPSSFLNKLGFIRTIEDSESVDFEDDDKSDFESEDHPRKKNHSGFCSGFRDFFSSSLPDDIENHWNDIKTHTKKPLSALDEKIAIVRAKRKEKQNKVESTTSQQNPDNYKDFSDTSSEETKDIFKVKPKKVKIKKKIDDIIDGKSLFYNETMDFRELGISGRLLKALAAMNLNHPTPIQAATIPEALLGKDICGCAATGTGKTAAFMLPVLERLLYLPLCEPVTRVLVLLPTRELAIQVYEVSKEIAQFTKITIALSTGGLDIKTQETALRKAPDIIIATPGRLIDHLLNTPSFSLNNIEVLILDEADRMLDEYFAQQMKEIIQQLCSSHQIMLFSATMTDQINELSAVSLKNPVKIFINSNTDVALNLRQEFVRIRPTREDCREAVLAALVCRTFHNNTLVFAQTKKQVHRLRLILGLLGMKVAELHGNLTQVQRLESLQHFKESTIDILVATDVAARGLDIEGVKTVINFSLPGTLQHYIHRVGRTARAGKGGRSLSLVGEKERKILKQIVKKTDKPITQRLIPSEIVSKYKNEIDSLEAEIETLLCEEREEKAWKDTEKKVKTVEELLNSGNANEKQRKWFQTPQERKKEQESMRLAKRSKKKKGFVKQSAEDRINHEIQKAIDYNARIAKRIRKPKRARCFPENEEQPNKKKRRYLSDKKTFEDNLVNTSRQSVKKFRHEATHHTKLEKIKKKQKLSNKMLNSKNRASHNEQLEHVKRKHKLPNKKFKSKSRYRRKK